jgi:hypothetical protein
MAGVDLPVMPPVKPMLAKPVAKIPPGQLYEPKWDGFRSIIFRDGDDDQKGDPPRPAPAGQQSSPNSLVDRQRRTLQVRLQ